ncbi:MAG: Gfo/Idh/MocA family oxidoreductase [Planctomycetes bacterium]|nr:Gfo/Idh/MocA family oxidoreductase [Planctomycetota bacterium]
MKRRKFIHTTSVGAGIALSSSSLVAKANSSTLPKKNIKAKNEKLNIACIGCSGKGRIDIKAIAHENIVAMCDIDPIYAKKMFNQHPDVPKYNNFLKMLDEMDKQIDAVTISTPDHLHYAMGMAAIERGKHVFIQKPLAKSIREVRELTEAARRMGVVTIMGNQGHASEGIRLSKEWYEADLLGDVKEVHVWTQKLTNGIFRSTLRNVRPTGEDTPSHINWQQWIGPALQQPFSREYHPLRWRGWWDYGNGSLGDIGCHTMDGPFWSMDLGAPIAVTAETTGYSPITYPDGSKVTYEFAARGNRPPVKMIWYDGSIKPPRPSDMEPDRKFNYRSGYYMIGSKATLYNDDEQCRRPRIIPETKMRGLRDKLPPKSIPRVAKSNHYQEWIDACKGGPMPGSNFDHAGPLSEMVLLGNIAIIADGKRIEWDSQSMKVTNMPELNIHVNKVGKFPV